MFNFIWISGFFLIFVFQNKFSNYLLINGTVSDDNLIQILVKQDNLNILYKNKYLYLDGRKKQYSIKSVIRDILKRDENYHYVVVECRLNNKYKVNDSIDIVIGSGKTSFYRILKSVWEVT